MVIASPIGAITTELSPGVLIKVFDDGKGYLFDSVSTIRLTEEAFDRLLVTLLARQAERTRNDDRPAAGVE